MLRNVLGSITGASKKGFFCGYKGTFEKQITLDENEIRDIRLKKLKLFQYLILHKHMQKHE